MFFIRFFIVLPIAFFMLLTPVTTFAASAPASDISDACKKAATANNNVMPTYCSETTSATDTNTNNALTGPNGILTTVTNVVGLIAGIVAVVVIIIAGGKFVLSRGDSAKIVSARQQILYALVGLVVIVVARQIIVFILSRI
jgi:hypothetical protein